jgi:hypothetical protein
MSYNSSLIQGVFGLQRRYGKKHMPGVLATNTPKIATLKDPHNPVGVCDHVKINESGDFCLISMSAMRLGMLEIPDCYRHSSKAF